MSGQAQIMSAEVAAAVHARSATAVVTLAALRLLVLYGLGAVLVYGVLTFGAVEPLSLFGFQAMWPEESNWPSSARIAEPALLLRRAGTSAWRTSKISTGYIERQRRERETF